MDKKDLWKLPGTPEEQDWLRERLEVLTVREGIALDMALQGDAPADAREMVNLLAGLDEYTVIGGINGYEDLGLYYLEENEIRLLELRDYINLYELGCICENLHPGMFLGGCYVMYPERESPQPYDGVTLPGPDYSWSLRLKLASPAAPEGVWLALPDYNDIMDVRPGEIRLALDALQVRTIQDCTLLEARCSLPGLAGLETAYEGRLDDLIYDGQNLGFILQEENQGQKDFLQTYLWALEHEGCTTLPAALDLSQSLHHYKIVTADHLQDFALEGLRAVVGEVEPAAAGCFDLERYGRNLLKQKGYTQTADGGAYILGPRAQTQAPAQIQQM